MNQTGLSWAYAVNEDKKILRYILDGQYQQIYKGDRVWKQMQKDEVCRLRTWQSMKNRFLKYIIPHIKQPLYELTAEEIDSVKLMLPLDILKTQSSTTWQSLDSAPYVAFSRQGTNIKQHNSFTSRDNDEVSQNVPDRPPSTVHHKGHISHDIHKPGTASDLTKGEELKTFQLDEKVLNSSNPDICKEIFLKKMDKAKRKGKQPDQSYNTGVHVKIGKNDDSNYYTSEVVKTAIYDDFVNDATVQVKTEYEECNFGNCVKPVKSENNDNLSDRIQENWEPDQHVPDSIKMGSVPGVNTLRVGNSSNYWLSRHRPDDVTSKRKGAKSRQKKVDIIPKDFYSLDLDCSDSDTP